MKFNAKKVYNSLYADEAPVGSKGYFADSLEELECIVEHSETSGNAYGELEKLSEIANEYSVTYGFHKKYGGDYNLFYITDVFDNREN